MYWYDDGVMSDWHPDGVRRIDPRHPVARRNTICGPQPLCFQERFSKAFPEHTMTKKGFEDENEAPCMDDFCTFPVRDTCPRSPKLAQNDPYLEKHSYLTYPGLGAAYPGNPIVHRANSFYAVDAQDGGRRLPRCESGPYAKSGLVRNCDTTTDKDRFQRSGYQ